MKLNLFKTLSLLSFLSFFGSVYSQGNLIDSSTWVDGQATTQTPGFKQIGYTANNENVIENAVNPFNNVTPVWRIAPSTSAAFRGLETDPDFTGPTIDPQSDYRFSVWVKLINANGGKPITLLRGTNATDFLDASGNPAKDPYFNWAGTLASDTWVLMVGYVKGMNSTSDYEGIRGYYDTQGTRISGLSGPAPYRFNTASPQFSVVCQLYNAGGTSENMQYYKPRFEKVTGSPSIQDLANGFDEGTGTETGGGAWSTNANGIHYNSGNVGIGTEDPGSEWKLAVNGKIRSKEIKVETGWADYVFEDDYALPSLQAVEQHITEKGHLIHIPSAEEVEANGIELGEMNKLLLEKIEELTLYMIAADKKTTELQKANEDLMKEQRKTNAKIQRLEKSIKN